MEEKFIKSKFINKPLFKLERKTNLAGMLTFGITIGLLLFVTCAFYPAFKDTLITLTETPLGDYFDMSTIGAYFGSEGMQVWGLFVAIYAGYLATKLVSAEFKNGSFELIYTLNISRKEILRTKLLRLIINITLVNILCAAFTVPALYIFGNGSFSIGNFFVYTLMFTIVTLQVGIFCFAIACFSKRKFSAFNAIVLVLVFFVFTTISTIVELDWVGYFSPLSSLSQGLMLEGFRALSGKIVQLIVWTLLPILLTFFGINKFKNDDLLS